MQQPHFLFNYYIYSIYIYIYKYIHKYLTCTTNFEKGKEKEKWMGELEKGHTQPLGWGARTDSPGVPFSWPSKGFHNWTCCPGSSAACCWTGCADPDHPARGVRERTHTPKSIGRFQLTQVYSAKAMSGKNDDMCNGNSSYRRNVKMPTAC